MRFEITEIMDERINRIEELQREIYDLRYDLEGAEVLHEGRRVRVEAFDWETGAVLISFNNIHYEWLLLKNRK